MKKPEIIKKYSEFSELKDWSDKTKKSYISIVKKFVYQKHPDSINNLTKEYLKSYMINFKQNNSKTYYNKMGWILISLYECLGQNFKMNWFCPLKIDRKFVNIISFNEFKSIMNNLPNLKHKTITILLYSSGIRIDELLNIKIEDIDLINNRILIHSKKHGKDRYIPIHKLTLRYIKKYLSIFKPNQYLFNGQKLPKYSASSIRQFLKKASKSIDKNIYPHLFRHSLATNIIEKENVFITMEILGHKNLKSTLFYNHIPAEKLNNIYNPLDSISY